MGPTHVMVDTNAGPEQILAAAVSVVPRPAQVAWQRREVTAFTHFGMNTFTDREWGSGCESPATFAPERIDVEQWMDAYLAMGARQAMLTVKHHEGFVLYPTRYTGHSVAHSPVAGTDLLRRYSDAARAAGLKVGVYLSPADGAELPHAWHAEHAAALKARVEGGEGPRHNGETNTLADYGRPPSGRGRYGNGSPVRTVTIPTLVDGDERAERVASGELPSFTFELDEYNEYYLNQVYEVLTEYGPIDEFWLDGANPWREHGIEQPYDFTAWYRLIGELMPQAVVFGGPGGARWVGNEEGYSRETEWSVMPATAAPESFHGEWLLPDYADRADLGSRERLVDPRVACLRWFPAESDVSNRPGWFHHSVEKSKTSEEFFDLYERSVGRNSVLLINVPPGRDGRIDAADVAELTAFGDAVRATYGDGTAVAGTGALPEVWSPGGDAVCGELVLELPDGAGEFDRVRLGEDFERGQRVEGFTVDAYADGAWTQIASGSTIGHARILALAEPRRAERVRVRITAARATPRIAAVALHLAVPPAAR